MDNILVYFLVLGLFCPCTLYLLDGQSSCQNCVELEQQLVDSRDKVRILEEEIKLLKQLSAASTWHCRSGWVPGNGSCYYMPNQNASWADARHVCQTLGGHLATITSAEEEAIVVDIIQRAYNTTTAYEGVTYVWLGGFDIAQEDHWHWVTGEPFVYTNWRISHNNENQDCLDWSRGGWNDNYCSREYYFLCEL